MAGVLDRYGWGVTDEHVAEAIRRIVAQADPLQILVFGSRARGDHHENSDLDLAVVLDCEPEEVNKRLPYEVLSGLKMELDMVRVSKEEYDLYRPWLNSIYNYIDQEGVVLYDREHPERAKPNAVHIGFERRVSITASAA